MLAMLTGFHVTRVFSQHTAATSDRRSDAAAEASISSVYGGAVRDVPAGPGARPVICSCSCRSSRRTQIPIRFGFGLGFLVTFVVCAERSRRWPRSLALDRSSSRSSRRRSSALVFGFVAFLVFIGIQFAGAILDIQVGFGVVSVINPLTSQQQVTISANSSGAGDADLPGRPTRTTCCLRASPARSSCCRCRTASIDAMLAARRSWRSSPQALFIVFRSPRRSRSRSS